MSKNDRIQADDLHRGQRTEDINPSQIFELKAIPEFLFATLDDAGMFAPMRVSQRAASCSCCS